MPVIAQWRQQKPWLNALNGAINALNANKLDSAEYLAKNHKSLEKKVYPVPEELDKKVARLKLEAMGVKIDKLTPEQEEYLASWSEGT